MGKLSDLLGTIATQFQIGIGGSGIRRLRFQNDCNGDLEWHPTADRTITLPDASGTVFLVEQAVLENLGGTSAQYKIPLTGENGRIDKSLLSGGVWQKPTLITNAIYSSTTAIIPSDDTIPQSSEGTQIGSVTITPKSATSTLYISALAHGAVTAANGITLALFRNNSTNALAAQTVNTSSGNAQVLVKAKTDTGSTTPITITARIGLSVVGTLYLNGNSTNSIHGGTRHSLIEVWEVE